MPGFNMPQDPMSPSGVARSPNVLSNNGLSQGGSAQAAPQPPQLTPAPARGGASTTAAAQQQLPAAAPPAKQPQPGLPGLGQHGGIYRAGEGPVTSQVGAPAPVQPSLQYPQPTAIDQVGAAPPEQVFGDFGIVHMAAQADSISADGVAGAKAAAEAYRRARSSSRTVKTNQPGGYKFTAKQQLQGSKTKQVANSDIKYDLLAKEAGGLFDVLSAPFGGFGAQAGRQLGKLVSRDPFDVGASPQSLNKPRTSVQPAVPPSNYVLQRAPAARPPAAALPAPPADFILQPRAPRAAPISRQPSALPLPQPTMPAPPAIASQPPALPRTNRTIAPAPSPAPVMPGRFQRQIDWMLQRGADPSSWKVRRLQQMQSVPGSVVARQFDNPAAREAYLGRWNRFNSGHDLNAFNSGMDDASQQFMHAELGLGDKSSMDKAANIAAIGRGLGAIGRGVQRAGTALRGAFSSGSAWNPVRGQGFVQGAKNLATNVAQSAPARIGMGAAVGGGVGLGADMASHVSGYTPADDWSFSQLGAGMGGALRVPGVSRVVNSVAPAAAAAGSRLANIGAGTAYGTYAVAPAAKRLADQTVQDFGRQFGDAVTDQVQQNMPDLISSAGDQVKNKLFGRYPNATFASGLQAFQNTPGGTMAKLTAALQAGWSSLPAPAKRWLMGGGLALLLGGGLAVAGKPGWGALAGAAGAGAVGYGLLRQPGNLLSTIGANKLTEPSLARNHLIEQLQKDPDLYRRWHGTAAEQLEAYRQAMQSFPQQRDETTAAAG